MPHFRPNWVCVSLTLDSVLPQIGLPSTRLRPLAQDARIPVLLIQRTLTSASSPSTSQHGFLLLLPSGWSQPFLNSLVFTGTRVGGIRERQSQGFESGEGSFPEDWAGTRASRRWWDEREDGLRVRWQKKPPGKRANWGSLGWNAGAGEKGRGGGEVDGEELGGSPWKPDWKGLLASAKRRREASDMDVTEEEMAYNELAIQESKPAPTPWLVRLPSLPTTLLPALLSSQAPAATLLAEINAHRLKRSLAPIDLKQAEGLLDGALVRVTVKILGRGVASELGPIYLLGEDDLGREDEQRWRNGYGGGKAGREVDHDEEVSSLS